MGLKHFCKVATGRERRQPNDSFMFKDIINMCDEEIDRCYSFFVAEVKNESGEDYKPNSLFEIICSIQHHMRKEKRFISILDEKTCRD